MPAKGLTPARRNGGRRLTAAGVVVAGLAAAAAFVWWPRSHPPNPAPASAALAPLTASPFLNTQPGVAYVGDETCTGCHQGIAETYHQHPMGRSLFHAADAPSLEQFDPKSNNPFQSGPFHFQVVRDGPKMIHKEWCQNARGEVVAEHQEEITYAVGAGAQGRSYFFGRDGFLFESPITWYSQDSQWQLSPGYTGNLMHFSRRIDAQCLYCHSQEARPVENTINRYQEPPFGQLAIGCERCHGPAERHVAERRQGLPPEEVDYTIVNPRRLAPALRDAVCEQCHLQGEELVPRRGRSQTDYRPGLPLHEYVAIFVRPPEAEDSRRIVGHVEQIHESACYAKSAGKFRCTSCHDPHRPPPQDHKAAFYQQRCRNCHAAPQQPPPDGDGFPAPDCRAAPAERQARNDDCLACHMPRSTSSTASHLAVTDHRLLRRPEQPRELHSAFHAGDVPLIAFHRDLYDPGDEEGRRDLAIAAVQAAAAARNAGARPISSYLTERALPLLDRAAAARAPDDAPALEARGFALFDQGRFDEAQQALDGALALAPDREQTLTWAVQVAAARDRLDLAETYSRRLVDRYPYFPLHRESLAFILVKRKAWAEALEAAQAAVRGDPFRARSRELLITALLETGDRDRARTEFDVLGVIDPGYQAKFRPRFEELLKSGK